MLTNNLYFFFLSLGYKNEKCPAVSTSECVFYRSDENDVKLVSNITIGNEQKHNVSA